MILGTILKKSLLPKNEICYILDEILGINKLELSLNLNRVIDKKEQIEIENAQKRRLKFEPLQYIFGNVHFFGKKFLVDKTVLIPRPETELLVDLIIQENKHKKGLRVLDIGTGSGCIAITLAQKLPESKVDAIDIIDMQIAKKNSRKLGTDVNFFESNIYENIVKKYDIIVSNPPYISQKEFETLEKQIKEFEPSRALLAKDGGLYFYRKILTGLRQFLSINGVLYLEIGARQSLDIKKIFKDFTLKIYKDLSGFERFVVIKKKGKL